MEALVLYYRGQNTGEIRVFRFSISFFDCLIKAVQEKKTPFHIIAVRHI